MRLAALAAFLILAAGASAEVVQPSPEFRWVDASGTSRSSKEFLGKPVIVLIAGSPTDRSFRTQLRKLQSLYERLAADKLVSVAVFSGTPGRIPSNIPFVTVADGPQTAAAFGQSEGFAIAVIGRDGNIDCLSRRVLAGQRVLDIINNSFAVQKSLRRD